MAIPYPRVPLLTLSILVLSLGLAGCSDDGASGDYGTLSGGGTGGADSGWGEEGNGDGDPGGDGDGDVPPVPDDEQSEDTGTDTGEPMCNDIDDVVLYLSPDDSNSMSSPVQVRDRVNDGYGPNAVSIRPWEFMNYYSFDYPAADDGSLALSAELRVVEGFPAETPHYELQLAVSSEAMTVEERPPMNVTLVLDTSGSMSGEPIVLLKEACQAIAASLRAGDKVSMVQWDTNDVWQLAGYAVEGPNDPLLLEKIDELAAGGGTDLNGGLTSGYALAQQTWDVGAVNRLVLISDGGANAGVTDVDIIAENAVFGGSDGIYLVGAGVVISSGTYNDDLMDTVTDAGKGASVFIDTPVEAWKIFNEDFINTMVIAARNVQVELTLPPGFEIVKFSGEEFSGDPKEVEPQHIAPNDSMVFYQELVTCAPELVDDSAQITVRARWEDVTTFETVEVERVFTVAELLAGDTSQMDKGAAILAYTDALVAYKKGDLSGITAAYAALDVADASLPGDPDLAEIRSILDTL